MKDNATDIIQKINPGAKNQYRLPESRIKAMFDALDQDQNGTIELSELLLAVREGRLGLIHSEKACKEFMDAVAVGNLGSGDAHDFIEYDAFNAYMRQREAVLASMFAVIDENGDGEISIQVQA
jgi:Ca2+-binding EF-hand superfamily protein